MENSNYTNRRDALHKILALTAATSLLGLNSCNDNEDKTSDQPGLRRKIIPCKPLNITPEEKPLEAPGGFNMRIRVRSTQTSNQFGCYEALLMPKTMGPAPHVHQALDEVMYVFQGTASVLVGDEVHMVRTGGWHVRPRNILHTFWNAQNEPLQFFDMYFNQNFEDFMEEFFQKLIPFMMKNNLKRSDPEAIRRINELSKRFGITMYHDRRQPIIEKYGLKG